MNYRPQSYSRPTNEIFLSASVSGTLRFDGSALIVKCSILPSSSEHILKSLGGRKQKNGEWWFPPLALYFDQLQRTFNLEVDPSAECFLGEWGFEMGKKSAYIPWLRHWKELFDFQKDATRFLIDSPHPGAILSLSPGLGKSLVTIMAAQILDARRVLVISPLSLLGAWQEEIAKWSEYSSGINRFNEPLPETDWVVTNYSTVTGHLEKFLKPWDVVIIDESILIKNRKTQRQSKIFSVAQQSRGKIWLLSGSPISREVDDLWAQFHTIYPRAFRSYWRFAEAYCIVETPPWGKTVIGSKNQDFRKEFRDIMFVRHQREVLDLPEIREDIISLPLSKDQQNLHDQVLNDFLIELESGEKLLVPSKLAQMVRLMEIVSHPANLGIDDPLGNDRSISWKSSKHDAILELTESGYFELPAIIWVHWRPGAQILEKKLIGTGLRVALLIGDTPDREGIIKRYKEGELDFLILSTSVGKYGLTLTNTQTMIYLDRTFDMDAFIQSLHRVQRIGLEHSPTSIILRCPNTIDSLVEMNLAGKAFSISQVSNADLSVLLRQIGVQND